jgi:uncharacterized protein
VPGDGLLLVDGVSGDGWRIGGEILAAPVLIANGRAETVAPADGLACLDPVLALVPRPEVLLLGTGARLVWPPAEMRRAAAAAGIALEAMDSRAAARTWNVLAQEGRLVAALLT